MRLEAKKLNQPLILKLEKGNVKGEDLYIAFGKIAIEKKIPTRILVNQMLKESLRELR